MNFVKGDKVIVISGRDKGKTGTIQKVDPKTKKPTRIGHTTVKGKKVRVAKASGTTL